MPCHIMLRYAVLRYVILCCATPHLDVGLLVGTGVGLGLGLEVGFLLDGLIVDGLSVGFALVPLTVGLDELENKMKSQFSNLINLKINETACRDLDEEVKWLL